MKTAKRTLFNLFVIVMVLVTATFAHAVTYVKAPPLKDVLSVSAVEVKSGVPILPLITWGGDIATILANGNSINTTSSSIFAQKGLKFKLQRIDDFKRQVEMYMKGETPFLRCTLGMLNQALPVLMRNPRTVPVVVYQMTWSAGGDCLVVAPGIKKVKDLKGKTIALQAYGPHTDYLAKLLSDAGLALNDVKLKYTKDLTGTDNTPMESFEAGEADAAFVIIPDGLAMTSNGTVCDGSECNIKGARILMSTKTADKIIADVYVVRSDYFNANKAKVQAMVHGLLLAEQELRNLFKNKQNNLAAYKKVIQASGGILLDSEQATEDTEGLYGDCHYVGFRGNVKFFGDKNWPRGFDKVTKEIQSSYIGIGIIGALTVVNQAKWDFDKLRSGLIGIDDVESPRFKADVVQAVVARKQAMGTLKEGELFNTQIFFQPNQNNFPVDQYAADFKKVVELAATYGGAVIIVEGHSDPMGYLRKKKGGQPEVVLRRIKQAAKNLSMARAIKVRDAVIAYATAQGISIDKSQFTTVGQGIDAPKYNPPKTKQQWLENMRVNFSLIQIEAEDLAFKPL